MAEDSAWAESAREWTAGMAPGAVVEALTFAELQEAAARGVMPYGAEGPHTADRAVAG